MRVATGNVSDEHVGPTDRVMLWCKNIYFVMLVKVSVLNDALKSMYNAEKRGKMQVMIKPSSKVQLAMMHRLVPSKQTNGKRAKVKVKARLNFQGIVSLDSEQLIKEEEVKVPVTKEPKKEATKMDSDDASAEVVTVELAYIYYETRCFVDAPKHTGLIRLCLTSGNNVPILFLPNLLSASSLFQTILHPTPLRFFQTNLDKTR
nr:DNA repair protein RAD50 [Tanacetum cinerariifolium]